MSISKPLRLVVAAATLALVASIVPSTLIAAQSAATPDDVDGDGIPNLVDPDSDGDGIPDVCLLYTSPSPRDRQKSRMPSSA